MKRSKGQRVGTRSILRRRRKDRSRTYINRIMHNYEEGDRVAIVLDGSQQMGMPHRRFRYQFVLRDESVTNTVIQLNGIHEGNI